MKEILSHPAVQGGLAPFVVGLIVAVVLHRTRFAGLAVVAAFFTAVYLLAGFTFLSLTATRKIFLAGLAAAALGMLIDLVGLKLTRLGIVLLALAGAAAALWAFWPIIGPKPLSRVWLIAGSAAVAVAFMIGFSLEKLADDGVRAGCAGLGLGVGVGVAAILAASPTYGRYGIALAAGAGAFLLPQMLTGNRSAAGVTFVLPTALLAGLLAAGTMILAKLPWYALLVLALVPVGARLPALNAPVWLQATVLSLYTFLIAGCAFVLVRHSSGRFLPY